MGVEGHRRQRCRQPLPPGRRDAWIKVNSVGVAVFDELTRGTFDQVSLVRVWVDRERHLSDTLRKSQSWTTATDRVADP
jgi:hypothetical protein